MDAQELKHFLADQPPSVVRLEIEKHFDALNDKRKRYAHFISKYVNGVVLLVLAARAGDCVDSHANLWLQGLLGWD